MKTWNETFMGDYLYLPVEEQEIIKKQYLAELKEQETKESRDHR